METQLNNSNDTDAYKNMFIEAARQEARKRLAREKPFARPLYPPHKAYLEFLEQQKIAETKTEILTLQKTEDIDISGLATHIEPWQQFAHLAGLQEIACTPLPEAVRETKKLSIPLTSPVQPYPRHHVSYTSSGTMQIRHLVITGIELYCREHGVHPTLVEVSPDVKNVLPLLGDWEEGHPGIKGYRKPPYPIPIVGNPQLRTHTVRCWGN